MKSDAADLAGTVAGVSAAAHPFMVVYDPDATAELVLAVKSKEERKAIFNAVAKLREIGEHLAPPHMKPLQGADARGLRELRPRQGRSDWRPIYARVGDVYVILAVDRHDNFDALVARARQRRRQYASLTGR